jgi:hypothetical protein
MSAETISKIINETLPNVKGGTLRFYGEWFGRPMDNYHKLIDSKSMSDILILHFDNKEKLIVFEPAIYRIDNNHFIIERSSGLVWQWYYYGQPLVNENLRTIKYIVDNNVIPYTLQDNLKIPSVKLANKAFPAVEIC